MEWSYTSAKWFESKHGDEVMREVLVNYIITNGVRASEPMWKELCVKLKLCTRATKFISLNMFIYNHPEKPYHVIRVLNGRGQYLINFNVLDTELQQYLGE